MNRQQLFLLVIILSIFLGAAALPASALEKTEQGWELHQESKVVGTPVVLLTSTGIKIAVQKTGLRIVAVAPDWKIFLYNDLNKVFHETTLQHFHSWMNRGEALVSGNQYESLPFVKDSRLPLLQLDAIRYKTPAWLVKHAQSEHAQGKTDNGGVISADYCLADKLGIPETEGLILARFYGLTALTGVPLQFSIVNLGNEHQTRLHTIFCQRKAVPLSEFMHPSGYRAVKTVQEVSVDLSQSKGLNDMMEGLDHLMPGK